MIRRGFWLTAGAVTGIYGYRRVSALGRRLSASLNPSHNASLNPGLNPASPGTGEASAPPAAQLARRRRRGAVNAARQTARFARDVREGMELYTARHSAAAGSTLSTDRSTTHEPEDGH